MNQILIQKVVPLSKLYLDYKNFRFRDQGEDFLNLKDGEQYKEKIQNKIRDILVGKEEDGVTDIIQSYREHGFLTVNQVHVQEVEKDQKFVVIEGNRRIATLKYLSKNDKDRGALSQDLFDEMKGVPVVIYPYTTDDKKKNAQHLIIAGLDHITGKREWSSFNMAEYYYSLIKEYEYTQDELLLKLGGLSKNELRRSLRALAIWKLYKQNGDFQEFKNDIDYSIFREIAARPEIREWLDLNFETEVACDITSYNRKNLEKIFLWISPERKEERKNRTLIPAAIQSYKDIATLSRIINDINALRIFEESRDLNKALISSPAYAKEKVKERLKNASAYLFSVQDFSQQLGKEDLLDITEIENFAKTIKYELWSRTVNKEGTLKNILYKPKPKSHFTAIAIENFKSIQKVLLDKPGRINLIAGANNKGKTTILEAIYLLCNLNDPEGFLNILNIRGKFLESVPSTWIDENTKDFLLTGVYNNERMTIDAKKNKRKDHEFDKSEYLSTITLSVNFSDRDSFHSSIDLLRPDKKEPTFEEVYTICNFAFSTPFSANLKDYYKKYYSAAQASIPSIVSFMKENMKSNGDISDIRFDPIHDRFNIIVDGQPRDISMFGAGTQFIFYTSIMFEYAKNGIVLIDELENGIHYKLMLEYSIFIQKLAEKHNVQVFATSHSKECIDAFIQNYYNNQDIVGYYLFEDETTKSINVDRFEGLDFQKMITKYGYDLRGE